MRNLSSRWKEKVNSGMDVQYLKYADITLKDGTVLHLTNADLWQDGMMFEDSVSSDSSFDIGSAIINTLTLSINNFDEKYSKYDFEGAEVVCYIGLQLEPEDTSSLLDTTGESITDTEEQEIITHKNALIEKIRICTMTVVEQPEDETITIDLTCEDNMRKFDRNYSESKLSYPATRKQIVQDACEVCGVTLQTQLFDHDDYIVQIRPDDDALTFRQVLQWVAQIGCQWLRCDEYGRLCVKWYDTEKTDVQEIGSTYSFTPQHTDVVITGIKVTEYTDSSDEEVESYISGANGYVLGISGNKLIRKGDGQTVASIIAEKCVGMVFRPFESETLTDVALEAGDAITIEDRNGKLYSTYITSTTLQPGSGQKISCGAETAAKNSSTQYSQATQAYVTARKMVKAEKTAREKALKEFGKRIDSATGVYTTVETQEDGSQIFYLHDKPTLAESKAVWKMTSEAWGVSTDGGKTWNGGMTVDGDTIVRILNAVGVNAEWINAGAITVKDNNENIIFQVDMDTKSVIISGDHVQIGGKTATEALADNLAESKNYSDEAVAKVKNMTLQLSNDMQTITADNDGNIPTFPNVSTKATVMYGSSDITDDCSYTITKSDSITGSWSDATHIYNVTGLSADNGWVDIRATYLKNLTITKRFTVSKIRAGKNGLDGDRGLPGKTPTIRYASTPNGSDMSESPKCTKLLDSSGDIVTDSNSDPIYVYGSTEYVGFLKDDAKENSDDPNDYNWSRYKGTDGLVQYTHLAYANSADGKTDFSVDNPNREYIGMYVDFEEMDSTDPTKYAWSLIKGADGANGTPGAPGADGRTPYFHVAYANSADGKTGFSVDDSVDKIYIGQYTDYTQADSADPSKYAWTKIKGDDGVPGRTYHLEVTPNALKRTGVATFNEKEIKISGFYRDGNNAERVPMNATFIISQTDTDGKVTVLLNSGGLSTLTVTINRGSGSGTATVPNIVVKDNVVSLEVAMIDTSGGVSLSKILDRQTIDIYFDASQLTQSDIVKILSDDGAWNGLYYAGGKLYISFSAALGGELTLGGKNNGNGKLYIRDDSGNQVGYIDNTGVNFQKGKFSGSLESASGTFTGTLSANDGKIGGWIIDKENRQIYSEDSSIVLDAQNNTITINGVTMEAYGNGIGVNGGFNIVCGTEAISDGTDSFQIFNLNTLSGGNYLRIFNNSVYMSSSSSERYKDIGENLSEDFIERLYNITPKMAKYKDGYLSQNDERYGIEFPMFIAENVEKYFPLATDHANGKVEDWNERIMIPAMFAMLKQQKTEIDTLKQEIQEIKNILNRKGN